LRTFNKMPVYTSTLDIENQKLILYPNHKRMTMTGFDFSVPWWKFVIRGEFAEYFDEAQQPDLQGEIKYKNTANVMLGVDCYPGGDWNLSLQYAHQNENGTAIVRISKDLFRNSLNINTFAYIDVTDGGIYDRTSFDYAVNDMLHIMLGFDYFNADKGMFKMYDKNSEIWAKVKLSF